jgi:hypothetical protein
MYQAMQQSGLKPSEKTLETIRACIPLGSSQFFRCLLSTDASIVALGSATALIEKTEVETAHCSQLQNGGFNEYIYVV